MKSLNKPIAKFSLFNNQVNAFIILALLVASVVPAAYADITGTVFKDFNGNGVFDIPPSPRVDAGLGGMIVTAYDANNALAAQTTSYPFNCTGPAAPDPSCVGAGAPALGAYVLSGLAAGNYRVEFTVPVDGSLDYIFSGAGANATTVYFASDIDTVDLALSSPSQHCQDDPDTVVACFGRNTAVGSTTESAVLFPYTASGRVPTLKTPIAMVDEGSYQMGSVWGAAYNKLTNKVYFASALRAYAEVGSGGLGAIHEVDLNVGPPNSAIWTTVPNAGTVTQNLTAAFNGHREDDAYPKVAKVGIGDIDISEDGGLLYAMNLNDRNLYVYSTVDGSLIDQYPVVNPDPGCAVADDFRPWATTVHLGKVYVGAVCSEELGGGIPQAFVLELDAASGAFSTIFSMPLNYIKESPAACLANTGWFAWDSAISNFSNPAHACSVFGTLTQHAFPMPVLSDIEFDVDGSMILGFLDRFSMQNPHFDWSPDVADGTQEYESYSGGDIIRVCNTGAGFFAEGTPQCPAPAGEFYVGDNFFRSGGSAHSEVALGGLAFLSGSSEVITTVYDPIDDPAGDTLSNGTSGVRWLSNTTGANLDSYEVVAKNGSPFAKGVNLGDVELLCEPAPLEVGNYIWNDINGDGIQGASEPALAGVIVELIQDTTGDGVPDSLVATAVTDANGQYLFSNNPSLTSTASFIYSIGGFGDDNLPNTADDEPGLKPSLDGDGDGLFTGALDINNVYSVRIPGYTGQAALSGLSLTAIDAEGDASNSSQFDIRDSDGTVAGADVTVTFSSGAIGQNNHSFDIGFLDPPIGRIGDTVWLDLNEDGVINPGETGISGVTVNLVFKGADGVIGGGDDLAFTTITDASGNYIFENLPLGSYTVTVDTSTLPANLSQTFDFDGAGDSSSMTTISAVNPEDLDQDFGYNNSIGQVNVMWNGFCDQQNFLAMVNSCAVDVAVQLDLFGGAGTLLGTSSVLVGAGQRIDFSVNDSMPGFTELDMGQMIVSYTPSSCITANMTLFAPFGVEGQFFSAAVLENNFGGVENLFAMSDGSLTNSCYAAYNTFQPSLLPEDANSTTVHWLQLVNLDESEKAEFTVNRFDSTGEQILTETAIVNPNGRLDIAAGHEDSEKNRYGIVEIVPDSVGADYVAQLFRYGMDSSVTGGERMSSFSLADNCSVGMTGSQYLTVSKGAGQVNYIELYNINRSSQTVTVEVFSNNAGSIRREEIVLGPLQSMHIEATAGLQPGETGLAEITTVEGLPLITKSTSYIYRDNGQIQTAVTSEGRDALGLKEISSFNTFRNQINWLRLFNTGDSSSQITVKAFSQLNDEQLGTFTTTLDSKRGQDVSLNSVFDIAVSQIGRIEIETSVAGAVTADIIRVQSSSDFTALEALSVVGFQ